MACRWRDRPNLHEYCVCCSFGTRSGCIVVPNKAQQIRELTIIAKAKTRADRRDRGVDL